MRSLRVLIAVTLMVALCSVGSTAVADETDTPQDSTSTPPSEPSSDPEPTQETPAPTNEPKPEPTADPSPDPEPSVDPEPTPTDEPADDSTEPPLAKSLTSYKQKSVSLAAEGDGFAVDDEYTVAQDSGFTLLSPDVTSNDTGVAGVVSHTTPSTGTLSSTIGGHDFSYQPPNGFFGDATFTYSFTGTDGQTRTGTVTIHVTPTPPDSVAANDEYTVAQDSGATLLAPDVTSNDTGFAGPVTHGTPSHGTLTNTAGGHDFSYEPDAGYFGDDTFTYTFTGTDGQTRTGTVTILVTSTAPSAAADDEYTVAKNSSFTLLSPDVTNNDAGLAGVVTNTTPSAGTLSNTIGGHDFSYQPMNGFTGDATFTYSFTGTDGVSRTGTVTIHVVPSAAVDDEYTVAQDSGATLLTPDVTANDTGTAAPFSHGTPGHGTVTSTTDGHDFSYKPDTGFFGDDTFTYTFTGTDGQTRVATVTMHVTKTPPGPGAVDDEYTVAQDSGATLLTPAVTANDSGFVPATFGVDVSPAHGTVTTGPGRTDLSYKPDTGFFGDDTFIYKFLDNGQIRRTATVTIHVTPTPSAAVNDEYTVAQDSGFTILSPAVNLNDSAVAVIPNTSFTTPSHGTANNLNPLLGFVFTYSPTPGFHGDDSFTYSFTGTDGVVRTGTVTIHVTATPSAAVDDEYTVEQDSAATLLSPDVTDNDTGATGEFSHTNAGDGTVTSTTDGHDFSYEPDEGFFGDDTFTYTFTGTDGVNRTGTVTIHVTKTPIQAIDDTYTVTGDQPTVLNPPVTSNDLGLDPSVTTSLATQPSHGTATINPDGNITFTPEDGYVGSDSFTYQLDVQVPRRLAAPAAIQDLTGTVTLTVTAPGTSVGGDDDDDAGDTADSAALLPDTGFGISPSDLALALLLVLFGSGIVFVGRRGHRHG